MSFFQDFVYKQLKQKTKESLFETQIQIQIKIYIAPNSLIKRDRGNVYMPIYATRLLKIRNINTFSKRQTQTEVGVIKE